MCVYKKATRNRNKQCYKILGKSVEGIMNYCQKWEIILFSYNEVPSLTSIKLEFFEKMTVNGIQSYVSSCIF